MFCFVPGSWLFCSFGLFERETKEKMELKLGAQGGGEDLRGFAEEGNN